LIRIVIVKHYIFSATIISQMKRETYGNKKIAINLEKMCPDIYWVGTNS